MSFGKLVGAIVVANIITGVIFWILTAMYFSSLLSKQRAATEAVAGATQMNEAELNALSNQAASDADNALAASNKAK